MQIVKPTTPGFKRAISASSASCGRHRRRVPPTDTSRRRAWPRQRQKTYDRVSQLAENGNAPIARLDQATDSLHESQRVADQAKSAHDQAVHGYTLEEHEIAEANVGKALADIMGENIR